jgi:rubrerythrin
MKSYSEELMLKKLAQNPLTYQDYKEALQGEGWAIGDYTDMIAKSDKPAERKMLTHIMKEEQEHMDELIRLMANSNLIAVENPAHTINVVYGKDQVIGARLQKVATKQLIQIVARSKKTGRIVHRTAIDPNTGKPTKWVWAFMTDQGKMLSPDKLQYFQIDPDTGKERKVGLEERNLGEDGEVNIKDYLPKEAENEFIVSEVYEMRSEKPVTIRKLWKLAWRLVKLDAIGLTTIVFRTGMTSHDAIVTAQMNAGIDKFTILVKLVTARFKPSLSMKVPGRKEVGKIKRKPVWKK